MEFATTRTFVMKATDADRRRLVAPQPIRADRERQLPIRAGLAFGRAVSAHRLTNPFQARLEAGGHAQFMQAPNQRAGLGRDQGPHRLSDPGRMRATDRVPRL